MNLMLNILIRLTYGDVFRLHGYPGWQQMLSCLGS